MRTKLIVLACCILIGINHSNAQHVKVRLNFPIHIHVGSHGPSPFARAVWIGPEWVWSGRNYECIPGYWAKPIYPRATWIPGHWKRSRKGHIWVGGYWR